MTAVSSTADHDHSPPRLIFINLVMRKSHLSYRLINAITLYRIFAAPALFVLAFTDSLDIFKWLIAVSFFTDMIDGYLARKFKVASLLGARLDSIGDDLTILAGITGMFIYRTDFLKEEWMIIAFLLGLFAIQTIYAFLKYGKITSFHTLLAKLSALLQGCFLILLFFIPEPVYPLFYAATICTALDLLEEIVMVYKLPRWKANIKGLYWALKTQ